MKKAYIIAGAAAILVAVMIAFPPTAEPAKTTISVPVTVHTGDTLKSICQELADAYGDTRDWREITYYTQKQNNKWGAILPGDKLIVPLEVPAENALGRR